MTSHSIYTAEAGSAGSGADLSARGERGREDDGELLRPFDFRQMDSIINARSLAVVGASNSPAKFGYYYTRSQLEMDFDGDVFLVNPNEDEVFGVRAYPDLLSLPSRPDLVYLAIPAHLSIDVLRDCAAVGVRCVMMIASGFREIGEDGLRLEREALRIARRGGFRILGPNCFGIYNPRTRLTMLPGPDFSHEPGDVAFISQSGGFSAHVARMGKGLGVGFSAVVSYGNAADLDEIDLIRYFTRDPATAVISCYIEGTSSGHRFFEAVREAAVVKPVVVWKSGRGASAGRAVQTHTGSLAGSPVIWDSLLRQCGVITTSGIDGLCDVLLALKHMGRRPGRRVLICGGGGALGTSGADIAEESGLEVPALEAGTGARLREVLDRAGTVVANPLDIGSPLIPPALFERTIDEASRNATTDVLVFDLAVNFAHLLYGADSIERSVDSLLGARARSGKPVAAVLYSRACGEDDLHYEGVLRSMRTRLHERGVPVFPSMERALAAIARVNE
ncbi:MAG: CoA-binding protein [Actinobacteria bacterium]|nr:CoA-binding protein [Actinomycetota bacterium]MBU1944333.1 CoA-binding protein [Actinomycetota bacterium]MBU2688318.1 CoA-binding protein [Actinomycetota bacterium]